MKVGDNPVETKLQTGLNKAVCKHCKEEITDWTLEPDADDPYWVGTCECDTGKYVMSVTKVKIEWENF
jgi:hypothetical protein